MEQQGTQPLRLSEALISQSRLRQNVGIVGYVYESGLLYFWAMPYGKTLA